MIDGKQIAALETSGKKLRDNVISLLDALRANRTNKAGKRPAGKSANKGDAH